MRKYLKGLKRIMYLGLVGVMMFMMVPSDFGGSIEARAAETITVKNEEYTTQDTFESLNGKYDYRYLINNYNVIALDGDIESTHLVGAVLVNGEAYKTIDNYKTITETLGAERALNAIDAMIMNDYSRGISSYVKVLRGITYAGEFQPTFKMNYGYDSSAVNANKPAFYTDNSDKDIGDGILYNETVRYISKKSEAQWFKSPSADGKGDIYQSANFVDFQRIKDNLPSTAEALVAQCGGSPIILLNADGKDSVDIEAGKSYKISNATSLTSINIVVPEEYEYNFFLNPYPEPTIISFDGAIYSETYSGLLHYIMPNITVNNKGLYGNGGPPAEADGEFGERGNKIVWHFPDLVTNENGSGRMNLGGQTDFPGHILAPDAEIWDYNCSDGNNFMWNGGNLNGSAIVKAFHSGNTEIHMFPFDGRNQIGVVIRAEKTVDGASYVGEKNDYRFVIDLKSASPVDGLLNGTEVSNTNLGGTLVDKVTIPALPYTVSVQADGSIEFPALSFSAAGTYVFTVKEVIPTDGTEQPGITYDKSEYEITVTVSEDNQYDGNTGSTVLKSSYTIKQVKNKLDEDITSPSVTTEIIFDNTTGETTTPTTYGTSFTKQDADTNSGLLGAEFTVTEWDTTTNTALGGTPITVTSDDTGVVNITGLEANKSYKVVETKAPDSYELTTGTYYIITVDSNGTITITDKDSNTVANPWVVTNTKAEYTLPLTGGSGTLAFYLVGTSCIGLALIMGMRRKYTNEKI